MPRPVRAAADQAGEWICRHGPRPPRAAGVIGDMPDASGDTMSRAVTVGKIRLAIRRERSDQPVFNYFSSAAGDSF